MFMADQETQQGNPGQPQQSPQQPQQAPREGRSGAGWIIAVIILIVLALLLIFGIPGGSDEPTDENNIPEEIDVNVDTPVGDATNEVEQEVVE